MSHEGCASTTRCHCERVLTSAILAHLWQGVPVSAEENTRLVQSAYEAFGRGDMVALADLIAEDVEWVNPGDPDDNPNAGTFSGKEARPGLVWWSCSDSRLHDVRATRVHRPKRQGRVPG